MVLHRSTGQIEHRLFKDLVEYFEEGDLLVANNAKVFPARLYGQKEKTGAKIEVFLLRELNRQYHLWDVEVDPARKIRVGNKLYFGDSDLVAEVIDNTTSRGRTIRFLYDGTPEEFSAIIDRIGQTPIPRMILEERHKPKDVAPKDPLIKEEKDPVFYDADPEDRDRYQSIFAEVPGSVAAPAASLHFTRHVVKRLQLRNVDLEFINVQVNTNTYKGIDVDDLSKYKAYAESFSIPKKTAERVNKALDEKKRVASIGTTTLRAMESAVTAGNRLKDFSNWTDKFLTPNYDFKIANALVTNLNIPMSPPLVTACAFGGRELVMEACRKAVEMKYRFFIYGDAMLIL